VDQRALPTAVSEHSRQGMRHGGVVVWVHKIMDGVKWEMITQYFSCHKLRVPNEIIKQQV